MRPAAMSATSSGMGEIGMSGIVGGTPCAALSLPGQLPGAATPAESMRST